MIKEYRLFEHYVETFKGLIEDVKGIVSDVYLEDLDKMKDSINKQVKKVLNIKKNDFLCYSNHMRGYFNIIGVNSPLIKEFASEKRLKIEFDNSVLNLLAQYHISLERLLTNEIFNTNSIEKRNKLIELDSMNEQFYLQILELSHPRAKHEYSFIYNQFIKNNVSLPAFKAWSIVNKSYGLLKDFKKNDFQAILKEVNKIIPEKIEEIANLLDKTRNYTQRLARLVNGDIIKVMDNNKPHTSYFI